MGPKQQKASYYAVKCGHKPGVYKTWAECQINVNGFSGAVYKKFTTEQEAIEFSKKPSNNYDSRRSVETVQDRKVKKPITKSTNQKGAISIETPVKMPKVEINHGFSAIDGESRITPKVKKREYPGDDNHNDQPYKHVKIESSGYSYKKVTVVYTDGASSNNGRSDIARAGYGVYWGDNDPRNASVRLDGKQTNQRAEASAVIHALEQSQDRTEKLEIMTDSKYCINAVHDWSKNWIAKNWKTSNGKEVQNRDLFERMLKLIETRKGPVELLYVPGHKGVDGNEKADRLAVAGAQKEL